MKKTVVVLPNWLGDFVMALPFLLGALEEGDILLLGPAAFYALLEGRFPPELYLATTQRGWKKTFQGARLLISRPVDRAILLPNSLQSAIMSLLGGVPRTWGLPTHGRGFLLHRRVSSPPKGAHQAQVYRHILEETGVFRPWEGPVIFPSREAGDKAEELWRKENLAGRPVVVIHPFSSKVPRTWLPSRFRAILQGLLERRCPVVLLGSPRERDKARALLEGLGGVIDLTTCNWGVGEMAALLERASLFIGNDSGPGHLAAAVGTPTITIHGPTAPHLTGPQGERARHIWKALPCSPCRERFFKECKPGEEHRPPCLEAIEVEDVWKEATGVLDGLKDREP